MGKSRTAHFDNYGKYIWDRKNPWEQWYFFVNNTN